MNALNRVCLRKSPITERIEFVSFTSKGTITNRRQLTKDEIFEYLVELIKYANAIGVDTLTNAETGEVWTFGQQEKRHVEEV